MLDQKIGFWKGLMLGFVAGCIVFSAAAGTAGYFIGYYKGTSELIPSYTKQNEEMLELFRIIGGKL